MNVSAVVLMSLLTASIVSASQRDSRPVQNLAACQAVADSNQRLSCYDREMSSFLEQVRSKNIVVLDKEEITSNKRNMFGLNLSKLSKSKDNADNQVRADRQDSPSEVDTTLLSAKQVGSDLWQLTLGDGSTWTTSEPIRGATPHSGDKVNIKKGVLSAYFIKIADARAVKATRQR